jgi:predicted membrane channel-forming protein YqfA (hemolysin III family)
VPLVFGYHEVFHLLVVAAGLLHFVAIARLVLNG